MNQIFKFPSKISAQKIAEDINKNVDSQEISTDGLFLYIDIRIVCIFDFVTQTFCISDEFENIINAIKKITYIKKATLKIGHRAKVLTFRKLDRNIITCYDLN
jgi:hypothetical protein